MLRGDPAENGPSTFAVTEPPPAPAPDPAPDPEPAPALAPAPAARPAGGSSLRVLAAVVSLCGVMGGMLGGSALGVSSANHMGPMDPVRVHLRAPSATASEADPEGAGDGVMDDLDEGADASVRGDASLDANDAANADAASDGGADGGAAAAAAAGGGVVAAARRREAVVTSDSVQPGPAQGYIEGRPVRLVVTRVDNKPVEVHTAAAYGRMRDAAARDHVALRIMSGFRTMEHQQALYRAYRQGRGNLAAVPGQSNHQSGHALDLNTSSAGVLRWLERNARRFGFRRTVPTEAWHWEWW